MNWNEFKALVDKQLAELGDDGTTKIWYIDISFPLVEDDVNVWIDQNCGVAI